MTKFLHRPMFRRGGSTGGGITSGLTRPGYHRGRVVNPGGYSGDPYELLKGFPKFRKAYEEQVGPRAKSSSGADFWLNFGTNILAQPGGRPILQTLGTAAKEPLSKFQEQRAYEDISKREEERDLIKSYIDARAEALGESDQSMFSAEQKAAAIGTYTDELFALSDQLEEGTLSKKDYGKKRIKIWNKMQPYIKNNPELEALWKVEGYADEAYREYKNTILMDESVYVDANGNPKIEDGQEVTVAEWFTRKENLPELRKRATDMYLKEAQDRRISMVTGQAKGGRVGYAGGELVEQEDVNVMTPQGDVAMQETVEEGAEPDQLSYEELRSRLPVEITDDIVRLLVSSAAALGDFAQIQTQVDVDTFNSKYGVNLVLPSEA
jgi:hypothetical protein